MSPSAAPATDPFSLTLELLRALPAEQVRNWGAQYDWTMPVLLQPAHARQTVSLGASGEDARSAGDLLIASGDQRLISLLLRPDMFDKSITWPGGSVRYKNTPQGLGFSTESLWKGVWCQALGQGDLILARQVASVAGPALSVPLTTQDLRPVLAALHRAPPSVRGSLVDYLLLERANPILAALTHTALEPKRSELVGLLFKGAHTPDLIERILTSMPGRPSACLLADAPTDAQGLLSNLGVLTLAAARGGFAGQTGSGELRLPPADRFDSPIYCQPMALMLERLAQAKLTPAQFNHIATTLLDWAEAPGLKRPDPVRLTEVLARRGAHWSDSILRQVQNLNPVPSPREVAWLMLGTQNRFYLPRLADFVDSQPSEQAWTEWATCLHQGSVAPKRKPVSGRGSEPSTKPHTRGFPRLWQRAAALVESLTGAEAEQVDGLVRQAVAARYAAWPSVAAKMLAVYETTRLEHTTAPASGQRPRGVRI